MEVKQFGGYKKQNETKIGGFTVEVSSKKKFLLGFGEGGGRFHGTWDLRFQEILSSLRTLTYEAE